ncbi:hypothetical protein B1992_10850 [Pseudoxanthomonas broegbernensis]|uniref:DUF4350 domain-containing protein n=1 Tax=Pseudoxanthomonas broegbernensis TaxID=83619 RepID=A0A7V8K6X3_9GAMM|nr:DUF4350 domain-containing protein [Pseudoxanthomonas broegbernensis]KAF1685761.1 hypothetical protein B1992_10850 [Pseudoxanthomonas broegbernensis]MBB6066035.1 hypothetical protein [Pseudoxanthomonas broegbernensis]
MSAARRWLLVGVAVAVLAGAVAAMVAGFVRTHERMEREVPLPPRGEAVGNPLYALRQTLRADGIDAHSRLRLQPETFADAPGDTVLLHGDPSLLTPDQVEALLAWVARGGHLLLRTPPARLDGSDAPPPMLRRLGVGGKLLGSGCEPLQVQGQPSHVEFCRGRRFELAGHAAARLRWGDGKRGYAYARLVRGRGTVDLLADFDFLDNESLGEVPHQALARQVLAPNYGRGRVHLVHGGRPVSFWRDLARRAWPAWGPLALLLAAWLWRRGQRFGPWLPSPAPGRRSLLEHVRASGELLHRYGQAPLLHAAVRDAFLARLQRRAPAAAALAGDARVAAIATRLQLPHMTVRDALAAPEPRDRHAFFARVRTLIQMRNRL